MNRPRAVVFDLYETLVTEFDPTWQEVPSAAERLGVDTEVFERGWRAWRHERMTSPVDFREVLRDVCGTSARQEVVHALHRERLDAKAAPLLEVEQPVLDMLRRLRAAGVGIGLISNCSIEEVAAWDRSPLAPVVDEAVFSYQVGYVKPDRQIYAHVCRRLGVLPEDVVFVGDGGSDELAGADACGMRAYRADWFLAKWPAERGQSTAGFPRFRTPEELLDAIL